MAPAQIKAQVRRGMFVWVYPHLVLQTAGCIGVGVAVYWTRLLGTLAPIVALMLMTLTLVLSAFLSRRVSHQLDQHALAASANSSLRFAWMRGARPAASLAGRIAVRLRRSRA